jgi:ribosomal protein S3
MLFVIGPIFNMTGILDTSIEFFGLNNESVSASFLARYVARKVEMRFRVQDLFTPVGKELRFLIKTASVLRGYKIQFVGRLTRRGKVRTTWVLGGSMPISSVSVQIEHAFHMGILRNGLSCVRVWLYRHKSFGNYNYNFLYRVKTD